MKGISKREVLAAEAMLRNAIERVETIQALADEYKENRSEDWADSIAGEAYEDQIERIGEVISTLLDAFDDFVRIFEKE